MKERVTGSTSLSKESQLIIDEYESILRRCNAIDHDDQILLATKLLRSKDTICQKWQAEARFLLVDEYQDINPAQFELISLLSEPHRAGLFVVGDDDQSIYHFRGGSPRFIREFADHFGSAVQIIQMATSRRCKRLILEAANALVALHDKARVPKATPIFEQEDPGEVIIHDCPSDQREATIVATLIKHEIEKGGKEHHSSFILVPNRNYVPHIEEALTRANIPFGIQASESKPLRRLFAIEEWCEQSANDLLTRQLIQFVVDVGTPHIPSSKSTRPDKLKERNEALQEVARLWKIPHTGDRSLWAALTQSPQDSLKDIAGILTAMEKTHSSEFGEFLRLVQDHCKPWASRRAFFDEMRTIEKSKKRLAQSGSHSVRIMTMQSSKGLQANNVFIVGLEEGNIPRGISEEEISEDARLLFVAITRAIDVVHLSHARLRTGAVTFKAKSHDLKESRFLKTMPVPKGKRPYHPAKKG
jgi:DNA helicase-2/ATP-dependent DNA helicase PcrA